MKMILIRASAAATALLLLTGCGDHRVPERGPIIRHDHYPLFVSASTSCSGNPPICTTIPIVIPEHWSVTVRDQTNPKWTGEVDVDMLVYAKCDRPKIWPDCWKDADVR